MDIERRYGWALSSSTPRAARSAAWITASVNTDCAGRNVRARECHASRHASSAWRRRPSLRICVIVKHDPLLPLMPFPGGGITTTRVDILIEASEPGRPAAPWGRGRTGEPAGERLPALRG